jgi:uncharacterized membrane protein YjgN (DUF898 family)
VGGDKPLGLVIAAIVVGVLVMLPMAVIAGFYSFASVYAIIAGSDFGSDTINAGAFLTGLVLTVAVGVIVMAVLVSLIGRSLSPKRRSGGSRTTP